ncbi:MAG: FAD:protein FMN transferase [Chlamydiae bacterium]|nr:FAD:protein FMN transferase [Chlamydiota bacterium]MBI3276307.1 FAD:protein FMN transferase [Chlamydiota bacterium]
MLGTFVEISLLEPESLKARKALALAFKKIDRVHQLMSFHDRKSDVSRLNRLAFKRPIKVNSWTCQVLREAVQLSFITKGVFDCTVAPKLVEWEYLPQVKLKTFNKVGSYKDIEFLKNKKIYFKSPLMIDLGGIAKGFAVDQAVALLQKKGIKSGSVNAGGDLKIFGKASQPLYIRSPKQLSKLIFIGEVKNISVATSAHYYSRREFKGRVVTPIVNPFRGRACLKRWSVSVFNHSCMIADGLTKVVMLKGKEAKPYLEKLNAQALMIKN